MKAGRYFVFLLLIQTCLYYTIVAQQKQFKALLVTTTNGWHHESMHSGVLAIKAIGYPKLF